MPRNWFWVLIVLTVFGACFVFRSGSGDLDAKCMEIESVDLGDIAPSARSRVEVLIRNCGKIAITELQSFPSCGCIRVDGLPEKLGVHEKVALTIEIESPSNPGPFEKSVRITDSESEQWHMKISGRVLDILRTEPSRLFIETSSTIGEPISDSFRVYSRSPDSLRWKQHSNDLNVIREGAGQDWVRFKIYGCPASKVGKTEVTIFDNSRPEGVTIPVSWGPARRFHTVPNRIFAAHVAKQTDSRTIVALIYGEGAGKSRVDPVVKWASVDDSVSVSDDCLQVTFRIDPVSLKEPFQGTIAVIRIDDHSEDLTAEIRP